MDINKILKYYFIVLTGNKYIKIGKKKAEFIRWF